MKKFIASAATALLIAGGAVVAFAAPASAHTGDLDVTYSCDGTTGEYVGTATLDISQTGLVGATSWRVGTASFQGTPNSTSGMVTAGNAVGRAEGVGGSGAKAAINRKKDRGAWVGNQKSYKSEGREDEYQTRSAEEPIPTFTSGSRSAKIMRSNYGTGGDPAARGERAGDEPAPTVTSKADRNRWINGETGEGINLDPERPATTVAGDPRLTSREHHYHGEQNATSTRVTVAEAARLQSYPADFRWDAEITDPKTGRTKPITKTNTFLQVGNAVPPKLAEAILREVLS